MERARDVEAKIGLSALPDELLARVFMHLVVGGADLRWEICARCARDTRRNMSGEM